MADEQTPSSNGFVMLWRDLDKQPWYTDSVCVRVFIELVLRANFKQRSLKFKSSSVDLQRGQLITTVSIISRKLRINEEWKVKRALEKFVNLNQIKKTNYLINGRSAGQVITILNYEKWQKTVPPTAPPTVPPETLNLKGLKGDSVPPTVSPSVQLNNNVINNNDINNIKEHACFENKPAHIELRNKGFEHFWKTWGNAKRLISKTNTAPKQKAKSKFLSIMSDTHVNKIGVDGFSEEINKMCDLAMFAHRDIQEKQDTGKQSDYFNYESMHPNKYLSNKQWREGDGELL